MESIAATQRFFSSTRNSFDAVGNRLGTMTAKPPLLLVVSLSTFSMLGCDAGEADTSARAAAHGLGELAPTKLALVEPSTQPRHGHGHGQGGKGGHGGHGGHALDPREADVIGWVRWVGGLPYQAGPIFDETGEQCAEGQSGPVWYLPGTAGGSVERTCTIPHGKTLVFPLLNYYGVMPESYYSTPEAQEAYLADFAATAELLQQVTCSLEVTLDGVPLYSSDLAELADETWIAALEPFDVSLPDTTDNIGDWYGIAGGTHPATGVGYYARLSPLAPGDHTLSFGGTLCSDGELWFETFATYSLHVE